MLNCKNIIITFSFVSILFLSYVGLAQQINPTSNIDKLTEAYPTRMWLGVYSPIASIVACDKNDCFVYTYTHTYKKQNKLIVRIDTLKGCAHKADSLVCATKKEWINNDLLDALTYNFEFVKGGKRESISFLLNEKDDEMLFFTKNIDILFSIQTIQSVFLKKLPKGKYHNFGHIRLTR